MAEEVKRDVEERLARKKAGLEPVIKTALLEDCISKYLEYSKTNKAYRTYVVDEYVLKTLLLKFLQEQNITDIKHINPELLENLKNKRLTEDKVNKVTHNREITSIKAFLNKMVEWHYLAQNPAKGFAFEHNGKAWVTMLAEVKKRDR